MYGFIYKKYSTGRGIVYDGDPINLKHTVNPEEAQKWFVKNEKYFKTIKVRRLDGYVDMNVPIGTEGEEDHNFSSFINSAGIALSMQQFLQGFLNDYILTKEGYFVERFKGSSDDQEQLGVLLSMRNMIEGLIRREPIKVNVGQDKKTKQTKFSDWYIHQNFGGTDIPNAAEIENGVYSSKGFKLKMDDGKYLEIPMMGAYAEKLLKAVFPKPSFNGRRLQIWQQRVMLERGLQTVVLAPREGGKSMICAFLAFIYLFRQYTDDRDAVRGNLIHFFGLSENQLSQVATYIVGMLYATIDNKKAIKYNKTEGEVMLYDGTRPPATLKLLTQGGNSSKGRGERPALVIIDEAGYTDEEVHKIAQGTAGTPIISITTVNYNTKRNWVYHLAQQGMSQQRQYEPIDKTIKDIFFKYGLDKVTTKEQLDEMVEKGVFRKMRTELYSKRPLVTLKFNIYDVEHTSDEEKEIQIMQARRKGEKFMAAELFSEYIDELNLFNPDGLYEFELPSFYDLGILGFDPADKGDNYAMVFGGIKNGLLYIESSTILDKDPVERLKQINNAIEKYKNKCSRLIKVIDIGHAEAELHLLEEKGINFEYPVKWTPGSGINYDGRTHKIGKKVAVMDVTKEVFFDRGLIRFNSGLIGDGSLSDEMQYYTINNLGKFAASKGRDDQVSAMMLVCYGAFVEVIQRELSSERYIGYSNEEIEAIKEAEEREMQYYEEKYNERSNAISNGLI